MGGKRKGVAQLQLERSDIFPIDRIPFLSSESIADLARRTFRSYLRNEISLKRACEEIASHNYLEDVTPDQFLNEFAICGWGANVIMDDDED